MHFVVRICIYLNICFASVLLYVIFCTKKKIQYTQTHNKSYQMKILLALTSAIHTNCFANWNISTFFSLHYDARLRIQTMNLWCHTLAIYVMVMATGTHNNVHTDTFVHNGRAWLFIDNILRTRWTTRTNTFNDQNMQQWGTFICSIHSIVHFDRDN